jgi:hypothetical protein
MAEKESTQGHIHDPGFRQGLLAGNRSTCQRQAQGWQDQDRDSGKQAFLGEDLQAGHQEDYFKIEIWVAGKQPSRQGILHIADKLQAVKLKLPASFEPASSGLASSVPAGSILLPSTAPPWRPSGTLCPDGEQAVERAGGQVDLVGARGSSPLKIYLYCHPSRGRGRRVESMGHLSEAFNAFVLSRQ